MQNSYRQDSFQSYLSQPASFVRAQHSGNANPDQYYNRNRNSTSAGVNYANPNYYYNTSYPYAHAHAHPGAAYNIANPSNISDKDLGHSNPSMPNKSKAFESTSSGNFPPTSKNSENNMPNQKPAPKKSKPAPSKSNSGGDYSFKPVAQSIVAHNALPIVRSMVLRLSSGGGMEELAGLEDWAKWLKKKAGKKLVNDGVFRAVGDYQKLSQIQQQNCRQTMAVALISELRDQKYIDFQGKVLIILPKGLKVCGPRLSKLVSADGQVIISDDKFSSSNNNNFPGKGKANNDGSGQAIEEEFEELEIDPVSTYDALTRHLGMAHEDGNESDEAVLKERIREKFFSRGDVPDAILKRCCISGDTAYEDLEEAGLLGSLRDENWMPPTVDEYSEELVDTNVYLNTHEPFCYVTVGVQGAGKSHTMGVVLENCLIPVADPPVVHLKDPLTTLVLHYDQSDVNICEATGLIQPSPLVRSLSGASLARDKMIVLVSPSYYKQRKAFYGTYCDVRPLLFNWKRLTAHQIKILMGIKENDTQLYMSKMLDMLRRYQRSGKMPKFQDFMNELDSVFSSPGQAGPLSQRRALLESFVAESAINQESFEKDPGTDGCDLVSLLSDNKLVVADLTDPLLAPNEANGIFQVLVEQFRGAPVSGGKLLAMDEAHKYMNGTSGDDGLSRCIINAVRLMRHEGMRIAVSTQSPKALAPELLELVSVAAIHRFHSVEWYKYLSSKIPLPVDGFEEVSQLLEGHALVFAAHHRVEGIDRSSLLRVFIRPKLTADRGSTRANKTTTVENEEKAE